MAKFTKSGCFSLYSSGFYSSQSHSLSAPSQPPLCNTIDANAYDIGCEIISATDSYSNTLYKRNCCFNNPPGAYPLGAYSTCGVLGTGTGTGTGSGGSGTGTGTGSGGSGTGTGTGSGGSGTGTGTGSGGSGTGTGTGSGGSGTGTGTGTGSSSFCTPAICLGMCCPDNSCAGPGQSCTGTTSCTSKNNCSGGFCATLPGGWSCCTNGSNGSRCGQNSDCTSNYCNPTNHICFDGSNGSSCTANSDCKSTYCVSGSCANSTSTPNSSACIDSSTCQSGYCNSGVCAACASNSNCPGGYCNVTAGICSSGTNGIPCSGNSACASGHCVAGYCTNLSDGSWCSSSSDCQSGYCVNQTCTINPAPS
ncbi:MAG: hypothetical protein HQL12_09085 [Candidatus Omnitrophica bacterium]|nr:hypothetical protein [Candidatus Omnitrophota bacterium]